MTTVDKAGEFNSKRGQRRRGGGMWWWFVMVPAIGLILTAVLPVFPVDWWWVRIGDFPRVQLLIAYLAALPIPLFFHDRPFARVLATGLIVSIGIQMYWIFPYLPPAPYEVEWAGSNDPDSRLTLLTANVLQSNDSADRLLELIAEHDPDIIVLCEINSDWADRLEPLKRRYDFQLVHPLENQYGIALYSGLEVVSAEVRSMLHEEIPSIDATVRLPSGEQVRVFAVHPNPPRPGEDTTKRDAELILVGREVRNDRSAVVLGDLNDVGWSRTTNLFQEVSGLLDPRKGRGLYPTFDATSAVWRYPLDYIFHSDNFRVVEILRLPDIGSDHFPLLLRLSHEPDARSVQTAPELDSGDQEDAQDAVDAGKREADS